MHISKEQIFAQYDAVIQALNEARAPNISYKESKTKGLVTKVVADLTGKESEKFTKLINRYGQLKRAIETLEERQKLENEKIKNAVADLFDAEDEVLTKVVDTCSATLTLSKKTITESNRVDYDKVLSAITAMVPELESKIKEIVTAHTTTVKAEKSPALRITPTEDKAKVTVESYLAEMAMDNMVHPKYGRIAWENNDGLHQIRRLSDGKVALSGSHEEVAAKWKALKDAAQAAKGKVGSMTEELKLDFIAEAIDVKGALDKLVSKFKVLLNKVKSWSESYTKDLANVNTILKRI